MNTKTNNNKLFIFILLVAHKRKDII